LSAKLITSIVDHAATISKMDTGQLFTTQPDPLQFNSIHHVGPIKAIVIHQTQHTAVDINSASRLYRRKYDSWNILIIDVM